MKSDLAKDILAIVAMLIVAAILITCIVNNINHGIIYTGLTIIAGLGGYSVGRIIGQKTQKNK